MANMRIFQPLNVASFIFIFGFIWLLCQPGEAERQAREQAAQTEAEGKAFLEKSRTWGLKEHVENQNSDCPDESAHRTRQEDGTFSDSGEKSVIYSITYDEESNCVTMTMHDDIFYAGASNGQHQEEWFLADFLHNFTSHISGSSIATSIVNEDAALDVVFLRYDGTGTPVKLRMREHQAAPSE